jgi:hypothetical protein
MKVAIQSVADKGVATKERLVLKALADTDIGEYVLLQTGFHNGEVTIAIYNTYWFPFKKIQANDLVVLYSKIGEDSERQLKNNRKAHFFYWGLDEAVWNLVNRAPVVLHAPEWISKAPDEL